MRLIDADVLKKAIIKHLCVKSENNLLPAEKSIYDLIDKQPTIELLKDQQERIKVLEEEAKTKGTPQKVLNRKELADLIVGECPLCGALFNNEICPIACGWCGCLLDWKDGEQE